ncbi:PAAR domain-containing protein [Pseudomonas oryzihabitans]|uniref:PAAR domain-containing protein n=1 Tax=Pseudomonas oryzihabitans TaxID=47885 RepID=UPI002893EF9F|nr:PAAR domain-containing protein [Pseudomonas oryzihabitans]MDT3719430.1 DUF2235 domain-containing protein [Pseudomonas oryzihabitans]
MSGKPAARLGDAVTCPKCGTTALVQGSVNVFFDGLPAATLGHACGCGAALSAAVIPNVLINGQPAAVLGSVTNHGGVVIGGSGTVVIGTGGGTSAGRVAPDACAANGAPVRRAPGRGAPLGLRGRERPGPGSSSSHPADTPTGQGTSSGELERAVEQRITLRIGVFFDGTGNNQFNAATGAACRTEQLGFRQDQAESIAQHCEQFMRNADSSYGNAETNIARLFRLYNNDSERVLEDDESIAKLRIYIEGIGTRAGQPDSLLSMGTGLGSTGVLACVRTFPTAFSERYDQFKRSNPEVIVEAIEFDLFGFSRGAAAARHFANEVLKADGGIAATGLAPCFSWQRAKVRLNFIGLLDTVAAVADPLRGDFSPANAVNPGLNLYLPAGCARKVVQLVANDEQRRNFALTRVAPQHEDIVLPGAHADLGGGYPAEMTERLLLTRPLVSRERYGTDSHFAWSYRQAQAELARLQQSSWFAPGQASLTLDTWRTRLPAARGELPESEVFAAVRLERRVRGDLSLVYLRVMHRLASAHGVPLSVIDDEDPELRLPDELQVIATKLQAHAQGAALNLDQAETRLLFGRYVHLSAHWQAQIGRGLGNVDAVFVHAPTPDGRRYAYPNRPQAGYPQ